MRSYEDLLRRVLSKIGEERLEEIEEQVSRLMSENPRLTRLGALYIVADSLGVFDIPEQQSYYVPLSRLVGGLSSVDIKARVIGMSDPVEVGTTEMMHLRLGDGSAVLSAIAWREAIEGLRKAGIRLGDVIEIKGAYTRERIDGGVDIHLGRATSISKSFEGSIPPVESFFADLPEVIKAEGEVDLRAEVLAISEKRKIETERGSINVRDVLLGWGDYTALFVAWRRAAEIMDNYSKGDVIYIAAARAERGTFSSTSRTCINRATNVNPPKGSLVIKILDELGDVYLATNGVSILRISGGGLKVGQVIEATRYEFYVEHGRPCVKLYEYKDVVTERGLCMNICVPIHEITDGMNDICVEGFITSKSPLSLMRTRYGDVETVVFWLTDGSKSIQCRAWRRHARMVDEIVEGSRIRLMWVRARTNRWGELELHIDGHAKIVRE